MKADIYSLIISRGIIAPTIVLLWSYQIKDI